MIDGVCGGIAEYFDVDATIVRLLFVLVTLLGGAGFIIYIAGMILMPVNPEHRGTSTAAAPITQPAAGNGGGKRRFWGILLILVGAFLLLINLGWIAHFGWWSISGKFLLPILFILLGLLFIYAQQSKRDAPMEDPSGGNMEARLPKRELRRSLRDRKVFGVCGGIAEYFDIDSTLVRIGFVFVVLASVGWGILLYIVLGLVMPEEKPVLPLS
jgi:phage shock protein C